MFLIKLTLSHAEVHSCRIDFGIAVGFGMAVQRLSAATVFWICSAVDDGTLDHKLFRNQKKRNENLLAFLLGIQSLECHRHLVAPLRTGDQCQRRTSEFLDFLFVPSLL